MRILDLSIDRSRASHLCGAGSDPAWARMVARRAMGEWGFAVVKQKGKRPSWAQRGFYAERPR